MPSLISSHNVEVRQYADDIKVFASFAKNEPKARLQKAIDTVVKWSDDWQLTLSLEKCRILYLGRANNKHPYFIRGSPLLAADRIRDLGFIIDPHLKFSSHCSTVSKKALSASHAILRALQSSSPSTLLFAYRTYVRPILESGSSVFSPYQSVDKQALEKVQNYFTRRVYGRCFKIKRADMPSADARNKQLSLLSLAQRREQRDIFLLYKLVYGHARLSDTVSHHYKLRESHLRGPGLFFLVPIVKHEYRRNC